MSIREKFVTRKLLYSYGVFYDPETDEKLNIIANAAYPRISWVYVLIYQQSPEHIPIAIRFVFVDE